MTKPRALSQLLDCGTPARLVERVRHLQFLTERLRACLDAEAARHVQIADINAHRLLIQADAAAWATRLRYLAPQLLHCMQQSTKLTALHRIDIHIAPPAQPAVRARQAPVLPAASAALIERSADGLSDPDLRDALRRLARHSRGDATD